MTTRDIYILITSIFLATYITLGAIVCMTTESRAVEKMNNNTEKDLAITQSLKQTYLANSKLRMLDIKVETVDGKVTLKGTVPNEDIKDDVESIAWNTEGINDVISKLEVK